MMWPLDVFEAAYMDALEFIKAEQGEADRRRKMADKVLEMKERVQARTGALVDWWSNG